MTRFKSILAGAVASAIVAVAPAATAQTVHFVGAGSSAQFLMAAIAADSAACISTGQAVIGCTPSGGTNTIQHWTKKSAAYGSDNRDSRITNETGNIWLVWVQDNSGNVTDVWTDLSVDSTVGVRLYSAQESIGGLQKSGGQVFITSAAGTTSDALVATNLWADGAADVPVTQNALNSINTADSGGAHVNVGLTDIRPEDAYYATTRALAALNTTTYAGLGYTGPTGNIGAPINTDQGTGSNATPIKFALSGKGDPFKSTYLVPAYTTFPIGAAPIVFVANNGTGTPEITNLVSGVTPAAHAAGQTYPAEQLFSGTVACDTAAKAFGGPGDGSGTALTLFLREPLSGTMNTTEFSLFRTFGDNGTAPNNAAYGTQETGVINPTRSPYNPLALGCTNPNGGTKGIRERAIGTGEVVGKSGSYGVLNTPHSLGYIFFGFANAAKLAGANFNYLTIDGIDPIGLPSTNQELPNCTAATCPSSLWANSLSYPHIRDGSYKAWSIYRWVTLGSNTDPYGPAEVAQLAQDYVDQDVADFVPFSTSTNSDGLEVYHSHFTQTNPANNGSATSANMTDHGNTLGGGPESGGDEGGLIEGPFGVTLPYSQGYVLTSGVLTTGKGYKVTYKQGTQFSTAFAGTTITINGVGYTVASCTGCTTTTSLYVTTNPTTTTIQQFYSDNVSHTYPAATTPGVLNKKQ